LLRPHTSNQILHIFAPASDASPLWSPNDPSPLFAVLGIHSPAICHPPKSTTFAGLPQISSSLLPFIFGLPRLLPSISFLSALRFGRAPLFPFVPFTFVLEGFLLLDFDSTGVPKTCLSLQVRAYIALRKKTACEAL